MRLAAAFVLIAGAAQAASVETLGTSAAFAKIEANVVEAAETLAIAAAMPGDTEAREEAAEEFDEDAEAVAFYMTALRGMTLSAEDAAALEASAAAWPAVETEGRAITETSAEGALGPERPTAWRERAEAIDELADERRAAILEAKGAAFDG
jgi:hypothetical protein